MELPAEYAASAPIVVMLTTQHPDLLGHEGWAAHLSARLTAAAEAAAGGEFEPLQRCWRILKARPAVDRATCQYLLRLLEEDLPRSILDKLGGIGEAGRRFDADTLRDHDLVARQRLKDRYRDASLDVHDESGPWSGAGTDVVRIAAVVENRIRLSPRESVFDSPEMRRVADRTRRVAKKTLPLHYTLIPCREHERVTRLARPTPGVWDERDLPPADAIMRSRTITFCPRIVVPGSTDRSELGKLSGDWAVIAQRQSDGSGRNPPGSGPELAPKSSPERPEDAQGLGGAANQGASGSVDPSRGRGGQPQPLGCPPGTTPEVHPEDPRKPTRNDPGRRSEP